MAALHSCHACANGNGKTFYTKWGKSYSVKNGCLENFIRYFKLNIAVFNILCVTNCIFTVLFKYVKIMEKENLPLLHM